MKKLQFLALSMLLSSVYVLQASTKDNPNQAESPVQLDYSPSSESENSEPQGPPAFLGRPILEHNFMQESMQERPFLRNNQFGPMQDFPAKKAARDARIAAIGNPLTNESLSNYINTNVVEILKNMPETPTDIQLQSLMQAINDARGALVKLYPQAKKLMLPGPMMPGQQPRHNRQQPHRGQMTTLRDEDTVQVQRSA